MLEVRNLHKRFHTDGVTTEVLKDVSLTIGKGDFLCVVGRSGSGKSTLLNIMSTLMHPDSGEMLYNGVPVKHGNTAEINRLRSDDFSVIFQFHHLFPYLTAMENVLLPYMSGFAPVSYEAKQRAAEALATVGLAGKERRLPGQLSGGEQQRVAIARALVKKPTLLFADEPTGSLDKTTGDGIMELLHTLHKGGLTIVMVTHQQEYAERANTVVEMIDGRISGVTVKKEL